MPNPAEQAALNLLCQGYEEAPQEIKLSFEDQYVEEPIADIDIRLSTARSATREKWQNAEREKALEAKLRREDEIKEILKLSGMDAVERAARLTLVEQSIRSLKSAAQQATNQLMQITHQLDVLADVCRELERSVIHQHEPEKIKEIEKAAVKQQPFRTQRKATSDSPQQRI